MAGALYIPSDLEVVGKIKVTTLPNATGTLVTWDSSNSTFSTRTNAQIISDLNLSSNFVPYTGATANVNLGTRSITSTGGFVGNATTATTLATARTINGTSFNGSANITTANWGTARNITIGDTTKSVNGSGNYSWSLAEIGATTETWTKNNFHKLAKNATEATSAGYYTDLANTVDANNILGNVSSYIGLFNGATRNRTHVVSFGKDANYGFQFLKYASGNTPLSFRWRDNGVWSEEENFAYQSWVTQQTGNLPSLTTTNKNNLVDAINEVNGNIPNVTGFVPYTGANQAVDLNTQSLTIGGDFEKRNTTFEKSYLVNSITTSTHFTRLTDVASFSRGSDSTTQSDCIIITLPIRATTRWVMEVDMFTAASNNMFGGTPTKLLISAYHSSNAIRGVTALSNADNVKSVSFCRDSNNNTVVIIRPNDSASTTFSYGKVNISNFYHGVTYDSALADKSNYSIDAVLESSLTGLITNGTITNAQFTRDSYLWNKGDFTQTNVNNWNTAFGWGDFRDYGLGSANITTNYNTWNKEDLPLPSFHKGTNHGISGISDNIYGLTLPSSGYGVHIAGHWTGRAFIKGYSTTIDNGWHELYHSGNFNPSDYALVSQLPTVNNGQLTLSTGTGLSGSANFTANQSGSSTFSVSVASTHKLPTTAEWNALPTTNTTYTAGSGLTLNGTVFSLPVTTINPTGNYVASITQTSTGLSVVKGSLPEMSDTITRLKGESTGTFVAGDITLTAGLGIQIGQVGNEINIKSTVVDTTYSAGTGLSLTGTTFANTAPNATHTGDVTGATALTIATSAVTLPKIQNIATQTFLGRATTGTGNVEALTVAQMQTLLGFSTQTLSNSTSNLIISNTVQRAALTGDVTAAQNSNATTIATSAVTHAKYQNIATQRILGRGASGTGDVQELTLGSNLTLSTAGVLSATNTNTTYTAGNGISLTGTVFGQTITTNGTGTFVMGVAQTSNGFQLNLGTPPDTTYTGSNGINVTGTVISPTYGTTANTIAMGNDARIDNGQTAYDWGNHSTVGYLTSIPVATSTILGGVKLGSDTVQTATNATIGTTAARTYLTQLNANGQLVVNVPWSNTTYTAGTLAVLNTGTATTQSTWTSAILNQWLIGKGYLTEVIEASNSTVGGMKLASDISGGTPNPVSNVANRWYAVQRNDEGHGVVNIPWIEGTSGDFRDFGLGRDFTTQSEISLTNALTQKSGFYGINMGTNSGYPFNYGSAILAKKNGSEFMEISTNVGNDDFYVRNNVTGFLKLIHSNNLAQHLSPYVNKSTSNIVSSNNFSLDGIGGALKMNASGLSLIGNASTNPDSENWDTNFEVSLEELCMRMWSTAQGNTFAFTLNDKGYTDIKIPDSEAPYTQKVLPLKFAMNGGTYEADANGLVELPTSVSNTTFTNNFNNNTSTANQIVTLTNTSYPRLERVYYGSTLCGTLTLNKYSPVDGDELLIHGRQCNIIIKKSSSASHTIFSPTSYATLTTLSLANVCITNSVQSVHLRYMANYQAWVVLSSNLSGNAP